MHAHIMCERIYKILIPFLILILRVHMETRFSLFKQFGTTNNFVIQLLIFYEFEINIQVIFVVCVYHYVPRQ